MEKILDTIRSPRDLRKLDVGQLDVLAQEIRQELIDTVSKSGGHFASSLGLVEVTIALHYVFNTPNDRIVFDVGHQGYVHKMLTGRRERMLTIRKKDGLSGFLSRDESEYDAFGAGHAGTSISAALGMAEAFKKSGSNNRVVALIGDGSITAGMALEALNNCGMLKTRLIVVLNDNDMSISVNVGALSKLFSLAATNKLSTKARNGFKYLYQRGYVPEFVYRTIDRTEEAWKGYFCEPAGWFESFGFRYIGPIDGHSIREVITALEHAADQDSPVVVHVRTTKGKGFLPAEEDPLKWHGVTPFDPKDVLSQEAKPTIVKTDVAHTKKVESYSQVFGRAMCDLARMDPKIVGITAAMPSGTGLDIFYKEHPDKFYDVAICEQHAVTFAAGLACEGYKPVCAIYSTFLQRAYDQVVHDVCIQNLPVIFAMDRAGVVGNDGQTHQGVFDIAYLRCLPNMVIMSPKDQDELRDMLYTGYLHTGPCAIRYPRGKARHVAKDSFARLEIGKGEILFNDGCDVVMIGFGPLVWSLYSVAGRLSSLGIRSTVINMRFAKPLDERLLEEILPQAETVAVVEDHALMGGLSSAILEFINDKGIQLANPLLRFGVQDRFVPHASQDEQRKMNGYDEESIFKGIVNKLGVKKVANL